MSERMPAEDALHTARVLIVDDQEANVILLQRILELAGVTDIHPLTDPRAAVARCLETDPDILLLDLHMPYVDGSEVLRELRTAMPPEPSSPCSSSRLTSARRHASGPSISEPRTS